MNIIFLDVDGVLNSLEYLKQEYKRTKKAASGYNYPFDKKCMLNLKKIVDMTQSYLVVSSTWRISEYGRERLQDELKKYDLDERVIGYTKSLGEKREIEIMDYLSNFENTPGFIILDDDDFNYLHDRLVNTSMLTGLTKEKTEESILKLKKEVRINKEEK